MLLIVMTVLGLTLIILSLTTASHFPTQAGMFLMLSIGVVLAIIAIIIWGKHGSPFFWMTDVKWTAKLKSRRKLKRAALKAIKSDVRFYAMERLNDASVYAALAQKDPDEKLRLTAIAKVTDQNVLFQLVQNDYATSIRKLALEGITDGDMLKQIALQNNNGSIAFSAAQKANDMALYVELSKFSMLIARQAVQFVQDQQMLNNIIFQGRIKEAKEIAVNKLKDRTILENVALKASEASVRSAAVQKLPINSEAIETAAQKDKDASVRVSAMQRVHNQTILKKAVFTESDASVKTAAIRNIEEFGLLRKLLTSGVKGEAQETVIGRMILLASNPEEFGQIPIKEVTKEQRERVLDRAVALASQDPSLLLSIQKVANQWIRDSHTDTRSYRSSHKDITFSSDCGSHSDNGNWIHEDNTKLERFRDNFQ